MPNLLQFWLNSLNPAVRGIIFFVNEQALKTWILGHVSTFTYLNSKVKIKGRGRVESPPIYIRQK